MKNLDKSIYYFTLGHACVDWAQSAIPALLPYFIANYGLSYQEAASLVFANVLRGLAGKGVAVVTVSHDTELAAMCADTCSMMFSGGIVCTGDVRDFMRGNAFYTTDLCRMSGGAVI